jgi:hypothetical protein
LTGSAGTAGFALFFKQNHASGRAIPALDQAELDRIPALPVQNPGQRLAVRGVTPSLAWLKLAVSLFSDMDKPSYRFVLSSQSVRVFMAAGFHVAIW